MRLFKLNVLVLSSLLTWDVLALINDPGQRTARPTPTTGSTASTPSPTRDTTPITPAPQACNEDKMVPLKLINFLSQYDEPLRVRSSVSQRNGKSYLSYQVSLPGYMKNCAKLKVQYKNVGNDVVISVVNEFDMGSLVGRSYTAGNGSTNVVTGESLSNLSTNEKFETCLKVNNILKERPDGTTYLDRNSSSISYQYAENDFPGEREFSPDSPVKLVFASPRRLATEYGALVGFLDSYPDSSTCVMHEDIVRDGAYAFSRNDVKRQQVVDACRSNDLLRIQAMLSSVGNAPELARILRGALDKSREEYARTRYDDLARIARDIVGTTDEQRLRELATEYTTKLNGLKENLISPALRELKTLYEQNPDNDTERRARDERIAKLNGIIGYFNNRGSTFKAGQVIDQLLKYGLKEDATSVAEFQLRSDLFSRVYRDSRSRNTTGERLSFNQAERMLDDQLRGFSRRANEAERMHLAQTGQRTYTGEMRSSIQSATQARDRAWQRDVSSIQQNMASCQTTPYGFVQNPARCRWAQQNSSLWYRQALARREVYNRSLGTQMATMEQYAQYEAMGQRALASNAGQGGYTTNSLGTYALLNNGGAGYAGSMYSMGNYGLQGPLGTPMMGGGNPYAGGTSMMGMPQMGGYNMMGNQQQMFNSSPYMR